MRARAARHRSGEMRRSDPNTPANERAEIESMLNDLHQTGKLTKGAGNERNEREC